MKLTLINETTAVDEKDRAWFRATLNKPHRFWPTCSHCGKTVQVYWVAYPDCGMTICTNCQEDF